MDFSLPRGRKENRESQLKEFADKLINIQEEIPFKVSSRGWCYQLENESFITKADFDRCQEVINECRKKGYLPIDFTKEDEVRHFSNGDFVDSTKPIEKLKNTIEWVLSEGEIYSFDFWDKEKYFIMMLVEKVDLVTLFEPICEFFHIPLANSRGWSDINSRAEMAKKFKQMEEKGKKCVLLYCGDHDPFGLAISNNLKKNLLDIEGGTGWNPDNLIIDRFGLNYDFIVKNNLSWIENLISGSKKQPDRNNPIVKRYIAKYGERKVEANALVTAPTAGKVLCVKAIQKYLGIHAWSRFVDKRKRCVEWFDALIEYYDIREPIDEALDRMDRF
jgi:hypothetical protein